MPKYSIAIGLLLMMLGFGLFAGLTVQEGSPPSVTTLIPAFAGLPIFLMGLLALNESFRKLAMHIVALLALVGFLLPSGRLAVQLAKGAELKLVAATSLISMAVLCGLLFLLCLRSFIQARRTIASGS